MKNMEAMADNRSGVVDAQVRKKNRLAWLTVSMPLLATALALYRWLAFGIEPLVLGAFGIGYLLTAAGLELGYHRYFSHRAFKTTRFMEALLAILGSSAAQGPVFYWATFHRKHHTHTDSVGDPHSPVAPHSEGASEEGLWHAHVGWLFHSPLDGFGSNIKDLKRVSRLRFINQYYLLWVGLGLILPATITVLLSGITDLQTMIDLVLWTGFVRVFACQHVVWAINSLCHKIGRQDFRSGDNSRNIPLLSLLMWGAGWHNNHHAFPASASMQLKWFQPDPGLWLLRILAFFRLVWDLRIPEKVQIESKYIK